MFSTPTGTYYANARIYKATIYSEAGAVLTDFVPALNTSTNKYGLYDLHNSSFKANVSSGGVDFTPGDYSYVTSSTIVTQPSNHTLYAVWG